MFVTVCSHPISAVRFVGIFVGIGRTSVHGDFRYSERTEMREGAIYEGAARALYCSALSVSKARHSTSLARIRSSRAKSCSRSARNPDALAALARPIAGARNNGNAHFLRGVARELQKLGRGTLIKARKDGDQSQDPSASRRSSGKISGKRLVWTLSWERPTMTPAL